MPDADSTIFRVDSTGSFTSLRIAVLIPCYNEAAAIERVVTDFRRHLPAGTVYVYDNNSTDGTAALAAAAGAVVRRETRQGKGFVVRRMFSDIEADVFVMVDGDDTYDAAAVPVMVAHLIEQNLDMVNGARDAVADVAYRPGHKFGNWMLSRLVRSIFGDEFRDMLSGYRVFSRRFVKSFPIMSNGFEIETELTIHALELEMPTVEVMTGFKERPEGSESKLSTLRDGVRILATIVSMLKLEKPIVLFGAVAGAATLLAAGLIWPVFVEYAATGLVPRLPTAVLATGLVLFACLSLTCGLILDTVTRGRREAKRMTYLAFPSVAASDESLGGRPDDWSSGRAPARAPGRRAAA